MWIHLRRALSVLTSSLTLASLVLLATPSRAAEKARLRVDDYRIEAELEAQAKGLARKLTELDRVARELVNALDLPPPEPRFEPPVPALVTPKLKDETWISSLCLSS